MLCNFIYTKGVRVLNIIAIDDETMVLKMLLSVLKETVEDSQITGFDDPEQAMEYIKKNHCDIVFIDIELGSVSGIELAKRIKGIYPKINIIFVTGYSEYTYDAFKLHASGYIMKPPTKKKILDELNNLRNPILTEKKELLTVQCFGHFEVFNHHEPLKFARSKTKELFAYLIDRQGASVTVSDICSVLWEDAESETKQKAYLRKLTEDLVKTLDKCDASDVLIKSRNKYAIDVSRVNCDYYRYLENDPNAVRLFNGEYMTQYTWGESTLGNLMFE